jgi:hypothetical protein
VGHRVQVVETRFQDVRGNRQPGREDAVENLRDPTAPACREGGVGPEEGADAVPMPMIGTRRSRRATSVASVRNRT